MRTPARAYTLHVDYAFASRRLTIPWGRYAAIGALAGLGIALCAGAFGGLHHNAFLVALVMLPMFVLGGALAGLVAARCGRKAVWPLVWAVVGAALVSVLEPYGWALGALLGGLAHGAWERSVARAARAVLVGALVGVAGWALCLAYLAAATELLGLHLA